MLSLLPVSTGCTETTIGGMTVREAFPDERVAKLIEAVSDGDYAEADKQLKAGADVNMVGTDTISPLLWVITTRNLKGVEYLLKFGANPNYHAKRKASAMSFAAGGNMLELLELLLKYKGDPNLIGPGGDPILHFAVMQHRKENIKLLVQHSADVNIQSNGDTAARVAARLGSFDIVAYFLEKGLSNDLQGLAKSVEIRHVPPDSEAQRWKDKVIETLKERGVKFPAFVPKKPKGLPNR